MARVLKRLPSPSLIQHLQQIAPSLYLLRLQNTKIFLNKAPFIGFAILSYAKLKMGQFIHQGLRPGLEQKGGVGRLYFTDTDSFCLGITPKGLLPQLLTDSPLSNFVDVSSFGFPESSVKRGCPGLFKNEIKATQELSAIVCLSPKCYCFLVRDRKTRAIVDTVKRSKGVKSRLLQRHVHFQHYVQCLQSESLEEAPLQTFRSIVSKDGTLMLTTVKKVPLTLFDTKQAWKGCQLCSTPYPYLPLYDHDRSQCPLFADLMTTPEGL